MNTAAQLTEAQQRTQEKRRETLTAQLALKGYELRLLDCGAWVIGRWNLTRELPTLDEVETFARQVGAVA